MQHKGREDGQHASVASFNTSSCSLGLHSCPIKPSSSYLLHCAPLSVCLGLVKIYFYQMLSALLTSAHLSHCSSAHLIRFAWPNMKSTIQEATHNYVWLAQFTGAFNLPQLLHPCFPLLHGLKMSGFINSNLHMALGGFLEFRLNIIFARKLV